MPSCAQPMKALAPPRPRFPVWTNKRARDLPSFGGSPRRSKQVQRWSPVAENLAAPFVLHVIIRDADALVGREVVRRALVSGWQRAADWELSTIAAPLVGAGAGQLSVEEAATLMAETFPRGTEGCPMELHIVVEQDADRELVEAIVRRIA